MKIGIGIAALIGLSLLIGLIGYYGVTDIGAALKGAGFGLAAITAFHWIPLTCSALGWRSLCKDQDQHSLGRYIFSRWIREAVNGLLPVAQLGGNVVGARLLVLKGMRGYQAGAGVIADVGLEALSQAVFALIGLSLLLLGGTGDVHVGWLITGATLITASAIGFFIAQRSGMFKLLERFLDKLAERWPALSMGDMNGLHDAIVNLHQNHRALVASFGWHMLSWFMGIGEVWIALYVLGYPVSFAEALVLESLGQAIRAAAFMIPGALGVQEGGYVVIGALYGLTPELAIALSLTKRVRELGLGLPALATWQWLEFRRLIKSKA